MLERGAVRRGEAGLARCGVFQYGEFGCGVARSVMARRVPLRLGLARQGRHGEAGLVRCGMSGRGLSRYGQLRHGEARRGRRGKAGRGPSRYGVVGHGRQGGVRCDVASLGEARSGKATCINNQIK